MPQFFIDSKLELGREVQLRGKEARHIAGSLRLTVGDWIILSNGDGRSFRSMITKASPSTIRATVGEELLRSVNSLPPVLSLALCKAARFEWAIEKCIELGCTHILPFTSARTSVDSSEGKIERWNRIATEAAKQSGLPWRPKVEGVVGFEEICAKFTDYSHTLLFYEGERCEDIRSFTRTHDLSSKLPPLIIIGPEGGFRDEEISMAIAKGAAIVSLGSQILRVETAAMTSIAIIQYELGNLNLQDSSQEIC